MYFSNVQIIQCKHPAPGQGLQLPTVTRMFVVITDQASSDNDQIIRADTASHLKSPESGEERRPPSEITELDLEKRNVISGIIGMLM